MANQLRKFTTQLEFVDSTLGHQIRIFKKNTFKSSRTKFCWFHRCGQAADTRCNNCPRAPASLGQLAQPRKKLS